MVSTEQIHFWDTATAHMNLCWGAVRSGKTVITTAKFLDWLERENPSDEAVCIVGKTERTILHNIVYPLLDPFLQDDMKYRLGSGELNLMGKRCYIFGANDIRAATKIQGVTLAGGLIDEMATLDPDLVTMLLTRFSEPEARVFATTNPDAPSHWLKERYIDKADEIGWNVYHFTLENNPHVKQHVKDKILAETRAAGEQWYKRYYLGEWIAAAGSIYAFDPEGEHVLDEVPDGVGIVDAVVGADYGAKHATCFIYLGLGTDNNIYILDEYYWDGEWGMRTDQQHSDHYRAWMNNKPIRAPGVPVYVDSSAQHLKYQLEVDGLGPGFNADNSPGSVIDGINNVAVLLGTGKLKFIRSNTVTLRKQLSGYVWDELSEKKGEPIPQKLADHACDALRYGIVGCFPWWDHWVTWKGATN